jgi:hypothetical protein
MRVAGQQIAYTIQVETLATFQRFSHAMLQRYHMNPALADVPIRVSASMAHVALTNLAAIILFFIKFVPYIGYIECFCALTGA